MSVRVRLIAVFLALSVIPLSAVTVYSYVSTTRAFRSAVEAEAGSMASDLGRRMGLVTAELGDRMNSMWQARAFDAGDRPRLDPTRPDALRGALTAALGDGAMFVERVEFTAPPAPGGAGPGTRATAGGMPATGLAASEAGAPTSRLPIGPSSSEGRGAPPGAPPPPPPPPSPHRSIPGEPGRRVVIDLQTLKELGVPPPGGRLPAVDAILAEAAKATGDLTDPRTAAALAAMRQQIRAIESKAARRAEEVGRRAIARVRGRDFDLTLPPGDAGQGDMHARLNLKRVVGAVLGMTRTDRGEIPFALDAERVVHTLGPSDRDALERLRLLEPVRAGEKGGAEHRVGDWIVVTRSDPCGLTFGVARPVGGGLQEIRAASVRNLAIGLGIIGLAFIGIVPLSGRMTRNLSTLTAGVREIARGNLTARVPVRSNDDFGALARAFNQMAEDLVRHEKRLVQQERLRRELEVCRQIQNEMLPHAALRLGLTEVRGVSIPAREVGGDFFNYFLLPDDDLALLVGDVSGKGVGAALLMANIQATLRARLPLEGGLPALAAALDADIAANTPAEVYVTLFVGILDSRRSTLRYVNAGHNTQFILRGNGLECLASTGLPLGLLPGRGHEERQVALSAGDLLFFYTDGMIEVEGETGEMFGTERLQALLQRAVGADVDGILSLVEDAVRTFRGTVEPGDDATMMALRFGVALPISPA